MTVTLFSRTGGSIYTTSSEVLVAYLNLHVKVDYVTKDKPSKTFDALFAPENRFVPAVYDSETKFLINQQVAVNRYLLSLSKDTKGLEGSNPNDKFEILQWTNRVDSDVVRPLLYLVKSRKQGEITQEQVAEHVKAHSRGFDVLEAHLKANTYLVGETLTLADIESASMLMLLAQNDPKAFPVADFIIEYFTQSTWRKEHPAFVRWLTTILASTPFRKWGEKKAAEAQKAQKSEKKAEKKSEKKVEQPLDEPAPEKKAVHPLSLLGKSSIPIDELKRTYSNKETREEALPWFWNEFYNDEEWSVWKVDYKYNDELTLTFMSNNLIGGFFNRLSASTKYIFGAAVVYGENNNNGIRGAFVIRGKEFMPAFDVAPDWESFDFKRVDTSDPAQRAEVDDLWAWDKPLVVNGEEREIVDGKVFK